MTKPLLIATALLLLPVAASATIHELRADPARTAIETVAIEPVGPRIAELAAACQVASDRLDQLTGQQGASAAEITGLIATLTALRRRVEGLAADAHELRYWTRQAIEREQIPARAWRGFLAERDVRRLQDAVRGRLDQFVADDAALHRLEEQLARLTATAASLTAGAAPPANATDTTP